MKNYYVEKISTTEKVLGNLISGRPLGFKTIGETLEMFDEKENKRYIKRSLSVVLQRMKQQGLIQNKNSQWKITQKGVSRFKEKSNSKKLLSATPELVDFLNKQKQNTIVIFDIPEKFRKHRDWLRIELGTYGYKQIQKSVWLGPSLPKSFIKILDQENILKYIRFFKAEEKNIL